MKNRADILNELKELSPVLFRLKETEKLPVVPEGYFNTLSAVAFKKIEVMEELKGISPVLSEIKLQEVKPIVPQNYFEHLHSTVSLLKNKKENIEVPEGYFETFADRLLVRIKEEEKLIGEGKLIPLKREKNNIIRIFSRAAIAASFIGVIIFGVKNYNKTVLPVNDCQDGIACLTQDEIYNYMHSNSHDFSMQQVQETVSPAIDKTETKLNIDNTEATHYIDENKNVLDVDDASTDIF
ncbi:MAG: hypothetical protein JWN78_1310 [Bacteroidota bacterium]|nr:hypothetical protein [Bacteroidota bacterium]